METKPDRHAIGHPNHIPAPLRVRRALYIHGHQQQSLDVGETPTIQDINIRQASHTLVEDQGLRSLIGWHHLGEFARECEHSIQGAMKNRQWAIPPADTHVG